MMKLRALKLHMDRNSTQEFVRGLGPAKNCLSFSDFRAVLSGR